MTIQEILIAARRRIAHGWIQNGAAIDKENRPVSAMSPNAVAWDISGAIGAVSGLNQQCQSARQLLRRLCGGIPVEQWNDLPDTTKEQALALLDLAIERCKEVEITRHDEFTSVD